MFDALHRVDPADARSLRDALDTHLRGARSSPRGDKDLVFRTEDAVRRRQRPQAVPPGRRRGAEPALRS